MGMSIIPTEEPTRPNPVFNSHAEALRLRLGMEDKAWRWDVLRNVTHAADPEGNREFSISQIVEAGVPEEDARTLVKLYVEHRAAWSAYYDAYNLYHFG